MAILKAYNNENVLGDLRATVYCSSKYLSNILINIGVEVYGQFLSVNIGIAL